MQSTDSVVTYLIFEFLFSFQHVLFTRIHVHIGLVHILCMKMHFYFFLNIKHRASQLYLGAPNSLYRRHYVVVA